MPPRSTLKYDLALLFAVLVWGINFVVIKAALGVMHPHVLNALRFLVSALVLGALYVWRQRRAGDPLLAPLRRHGRVLFGLGMLGFFFYQLSFIIGADLTTAGNAALIMASAPLWTAVFGHFARLEELRGGAWMGLLATFAGAALIVVGGTRSIDFSDETFVGNLLMVGAALLWGAYTAFSRPMTRRVTPTAVTFLGLLMALPFLLALSVPYVGDVEWERVTGWIWVAIVFSGGLSIGLAVVIWNAAVKHVGPSQTAVYGNLVPVVALISGALFLNEHIGPAQIGGGALILGGLLLIRRFRSIEPPRTA